MADITCFDYGFASADKVLTVNRSSRDDPGLDPAEYQERQRFLRIHQSTIRWLFQEPWKTLTVSKSAMDGFMGFLKHRTFGANSGE